MVIDQRDRWLKLAIKKKWSASKLSAAIRQAAAREKTQEIDFVAKALGKYAVLYADPPWRYEYPPLGGSNRNILAEASPLR
jgi:hypothetical protein